MADANTADAGVCDAGAGVCTLRAAVQTANSAGAPGFDTIQLPAGGSFTLTQAGSDDTAAAGDLDLKTSAEAAAAGSRSSS